MATEDIGDVGVDVVADFSGFEAQLRRMLNKMERMLDLNIPVDVDTKRASAKMIRWRRLQERALDIKLEISKKSLAAVSSQLASLTGINALTNAFSNFNDHIKGFFDNILPIGQKIGIIGAAAGPAATLVGSLTVGLVELGETLGKGSIAALIALPGLLVAAGATAFVFTTAFKDAPAILGNSLTQYNNFRDAIGKPFWEKATAPMKSMLDNMFPAINEGFGKMGAAAGGFTGKLAESFEKVMTPERIEGIFGNWSKGLDILADKAAGPLASITTNLIDWGSTLIPKIADKFGGMLTRFDGWLDNAIKTGELDKALDGLFKTIEDAWNVLKDTWSIFQSIADAAKAAGINAFPLVTIMDNIANKMKTPEFQKGLTEFFEGAKRGWEGLKPAFEAFGDMIAAWQPMISKFIGDAGEKVGGFFTTLFEKAQDPTFIANIDSMLQGFLKIFENLEPAIGPFMDKIGEIAHFAGVLADVVSQTLSVAIQELAPIFGDVLKNLEPLVRALGEFFQNILKSDGMKTIAEGFGHLIEGVTAFVEALNTPVIKFVIDLIIDFIATAIAGFANLLGGVLQIVAGLAKLLSGDMSGLQDIWDGLMKGLEGVWQLFITLFAPAKILGFVGKILGPLAKLFKFDDLLKGAGDVLGKLFEPVGKFFGEIISNIPGLLGKLGSSLFEGIGKIAGDIGKWLVEGLQKGVQALIGGFIANFVNPIIDGVKQLFGIASPSTVFMEIGQWLIQGLINGIQALINGVADIFRVVFETVRAVIEGVVNAIVAIFQAWWALVQAGFQILGAVINAVWQGILAAAQAVWAAILAVASAVWNAIVAYFNMLLTIATTVWNGILAAAQAVWNAIQAAIAAVINAIIAIIQGLLTAAQNVWNAIVAAAQSAWDGIVAGAQGLVAGVMGAISGIIDGVAGIFNGVKDTIMGIWNSIQLPNILGNLGIPGFATGVQNFQGGVAMVGENGPELVMLPKGADVIPNSQSRSMLNSARPVAAEATTDSGAGGAGFTFAPTIYNPEKETTEQSLFKSAQTLSYLGLV